MLTQLPHPWVSHPLTHPSPRYLHAKGIVHGDVKPPNVLLQPDPRSPTGATAKLADFGLAAALQPAATHVSNYCAGTPFYIAPEVVAEHRVTHGSDIYSLGVMMWQTFFRLDPWVVVGGGGGSGGGGSMSGQQQQQALGWNPLFPSVPPGTEDHPYCALMARWGGVCACALFQCVGWN